MNSIGVIMHSQAMIHATESINDKYLSVARLRYGNNYMKNFKRPAYYNTPLEQKDIHGYREEE